MAFFEFNVSAGSTFNVIQQLVVETECSTIFTYKIEADPGDSITMEVGQTFNHHENLVYIQAGVETPWDGTEITLTYGNDLYIRYSISNSGVPGYFNKVRFFVRNNTQGSQEFNEHTERANDSLPCDNPTGDAGTYDELTDTPNSKVGNALKLVRVNAAETDHEYVDPGVLGNDLNFTHVFASTTSVVINHGLGKIPSVTVIDDSGNRVHGDVAYTDLNNLTITFNTAFAGTAYLN